MEKKTAAMLGLCVLLLCGAATPAQQAAPTSFVLQKVEVVGAKRYALADVIRLSGLKDGQAITPAELNDVARRLSTTGLFKIVTYRYATTGTQLTVTFEIEEETWTTPVVFDNFVWFTDEELSKELRKAVPSFDGTAPANAGVSGFMTQELQRILDERHIAGHVEFTPSANLTTGVRQYLFSVKGAGAALKICAVRVEGASRVPEKDVQKAAGLVGTDYSRSFTIALTNGSLMQVYRRRGFSKAAFGPPTAAPDTAGGCGGVSLTLHVDEGAPPIWGRAEWTGNAAMATKALDAAMGMRSGEIADASKIDAGLRAIHAIYEKQGYLLQSQTVTPRLDDVSHRAVFAIEIKESAQYRMGALEFSGFTPVDESNLRNKWRLETGAVYDASVLTRFLAEAVPRGRGPGGGVVTSEVLLDRTAARVTVRLVVK